MTTSRSLPTSVPADRRVAPSPTPGLARRRSVPHLLLGATLVVLCAVGFATTALRVDPRTSVLALVGEVEAGHILVDADLTVVRIVADSTMAVLPESQRTSVIGRGVRLPLASGTLLSEEVLGSVAWPPSGQAVIAVEVTAGDAPTNLTAGASVLVLMVSTSSTTASAGVVETQTAATVVSVGPADTSGTRVVSLLMTEDDAIAVAGATGEASLIVLGGAG